MPTFRKKLRSDSCSAVRGFGLIELIVAISIMVLVSTVILARHNSFNGAVILRNQAYEVAFTLREAQNLATSAVFTGTSASDYRQRYGVHMQVGNPIYYLFRDANGDNDYDSGEELGQPYRLDPRFRFGAFENGSGTSLGTTLDVMFERPNFDAITDPDAGGTAVIVVESTEAAPSGATFEREVEVTSTGQITVLSN